MCAVCSNMENAECSSAGQDGGTPQRAMEAMEAVKRLLECARDGLLEDLKLAELSFPASELAAVKEGRGRNALHMAALGGKPDICSYLVKERHFDVNSFDEQGAHSCKPGPHPFRQRSVLIKLGMSR